MEKKFIFRNIVLVVMLLVALTSFTACGDDDDDDMVCNCNNCANCSEKGGSSETDSNVSGEALPIVGKWVGLEVDSYYGVADSMDFEHEEGDYYIGETIWAGGGYSRYYTKISSTNIYFYEGDEYVNYQIKDNILTIIFGDGDRKEFNRVE